MDGIGIIIVIIAISAVVIITNSADNTNGDGGKIEASEGTSSIVRIEQ
jgi:hypothetical protein